MSYTWLAVSSKVGQIIADLPDLDVDKVTQQLMAYTTTTAKLPLGKPPAEWQRATKDLASCLILVDEARSENEQARAIWGAIVTKTTPDHTDTLPINLATIEAYFDRRFVGDIMYDNVGQNLIVKDLVERYVATGSNGGIPIRVVVLDGPGVPRKREYTDRSDKTIYSLLQELSGVKDGPEWTVGWEWTHNPERITPVLYVGSRIGAAVTEGLKANAVFEMPGSVTSFVAPSDYSSGKGANDVLAVSTASGDVRPQSAHVVTIDPDRPTVEHRFTPSTSITDNLTLDQHAQAKSDAIAGGSRSLALTANALAYPRLGTDWFIGDDIGFEVGGLDRHGRETVPAFPGGIKGTVRNVGWTLSLDGTPEVTPVLLGPDLEGA